MHDEIIRLRMDIEQFPITPMGLDDSIQEVINKHGCRPDVISITKKQHNLLSILTKSEHLDNITKQTTIVGLKQNPPAWRGLEVEIVEGPQAL